MRGLPSAGEILLMGSISRWLSNHSTHTSAAKPLTEKYRWYISWYISLVYANGLQRGDKNDD
jgi:hypothetical protein